jgi:hypothetical protein
MTTGGEKYEDKNSEVMGKQIMNVRVLAVKISLLSF